MPHAPDLPRNSKYILFLRLRTKKNIYILFLNFLYVRSSLPVILKIDFPFFLSYTFRRKGNKNRVILHFINLVNIVKSSFTVINASWNSSNGRDNKKKGLNLKK